MVRWTRCFFFCSLCFRFFRGYQFWRKGNKKQETAPNLLYFVIELYLYITIYTFQEYKKKKSEAEQTPRSKQYWIQIKYSHFMIVMYMKIATCLDLLFLYYSKLHKAHSSFNFWDWINAKEVSLKESLTFERLSCVSEKNISWAICVEISNSMLETSFWIWIFLFQNHVFY
jgi:hypothetical protein